MRHGFTIRGGRVAGLICAVLPILALSARAETANATWNYPLDVPITSGNYTAAGHTIDLALNCVPTGNELTVIRNTGPAFIQGQFSNLAQGHAVALSYSGNTYNFVANYYGGNGNDLVLVWAGSRALAWGANAYGQLGDNTKSQRNAPVAVNATGALSGKIVLSVAAGSDHSLALCSDGTLAAWGYNYEGELGNNNTIQSRVPVAVNTNPCVSALSNKTVVSIAAGAYHSLALCSDGTVAAWGYNYDGELGNNTTADSQVPVAVNTAAGVSALSGRSVTAIASGQSHNLALCSGGTIVAWGYNADGELGNNSTTNSSVPVAVDTTGVLSGKTVVAVAAGSNHSLALCSDGTVAAWGDNTCGQLGNNNTVSSTVPVAVNTTLGISALFGKTVVAISAGAYHSLALCSDGTVIAWGSNYNGQIGDNTTTQRLVPVAVNTALGSSLLGRSVTYISAGQSHSVALCTDGALVTWGGNYNGQLGENTTTQRSLPVAVNTTALTAGERYMLGASGRASSHTLALAVSVPTPISIITVEQPAGNSLSNGETIDFGSWIVGSPVTFTFKIRNLGTSALAGLTITKDGANSMDYTVASPAAPVAPGVSTTFTVSFLSLDLGQRTAAIHIANNDALNSSFTLNLTGSASAAGTVVAVFNSPTDVPLTASSYTATGNTINLSLNCVPSCNELMVLKNTGLDFIHGEFVNLKHGQTVTLTFDGVDYNFVANYYGGSGNDLVLAWAGTRVFSWGFNNHGQIGDNSQVNRSVPVPVTANGTGILLGKTVLAIAGGSYHSLALCSDGTLAAWGDNTNGQLGNNSTVDSHVPIAVNQNSGSALYGKMVVAISAGQGFSLALCSDGTVAAWGKNNYGQLGDGTITTLTPYGKTLPVAVSTSSISALFGKCVVSIAAGYHHCLALCSDGKVVTWGNNSDGQLGNNSNIDSSLPVAVNADSGISTLFGKTVVSIAGGGWHSFALCSDGTLVGWGMNGSNFRGEGELGDGTLTTRTVPVAVNTTNSTSALYGKTIVAVARGGNSHGLALSADGKVVGWGYAFYGGLGDGSIGTRRRLLPVEASAAAGVSAIYGKTVVALAASDFHSTTLSSDGTLAAFGWNTHGELGNGGGDHQYVPVAVKNTNLTAQERFTGISSLGDYNYGHTLALVSTWAKPPTPICTTSPVSGLTQTSVQINGFVNARGYSTTVKFCYGNDGLAFPNQIILPGIFNDSGDVAVSTTLTELTKGTTYYYRLIAASNGGTAVSGTASFITRTEPTGTVVAAIPASTTSAQVTATINPHGSDTQAFFDYGTDPDNLPYSVQASPTLATGYTDTTVSAIITNITQGTTYYYRIRGVSLGGIGVSVPGSFQLATLSGLTQIFPSASPDAQGYVFVTLNHPGIASGWRFVGEQQWRSSGVPAAGLTTGDRQIEFRPVPGYIQPLRETISVISGGAATLVTGEYYPTTGGSIGGISVVLKPDALADPGLPVDQRAQWRFLGEDDTQWRNSGVTVNSLLPGNYLVECKPITGRTTPAVITVPVQSGSTKVATATYLLASEAAGTPPSVLSFDTVSTNQTLPYAYVGQIRSDAGSSTGFVVKPRVVATAAHVVFDDGTLSYVTGLQWLFQRDRGTYEPTPQVPRGFYVFDGYAAQRAADNSPGVSTPQSQNLDAAALYFLEDAGRGGYGGYLASDLDNNEFLLSTKLKMLIGYPVDGIATLKQGRMHATPAANVTFTRGYGRTFTTSAIRSAGGNSGGPLCIQADNGNYYPAAVYLGGSAQTVVRAIDSPVIDLFNRAEVSGNGGANNTGGGITQVNTPISSGTFAAASLKVDILPLEAATAGATWRLRSDGPVQVGGTQLDSLTAGNYTLYCTAAPGFIAPAAAPIALTGGNLTSVNATYSGIIEQPSGLTVVTGGNATFTVRVSGAPTAYQWKKNGNNITGANASSYAIPAVALADTANYSVVVTWGSEGSLASTTAPLNVVQAQDYDNWRSQKFDSSESLDPLLSGPSADYDHDNINNLREFAFNLDPKINDAHVMMAGNGTSGLPLGSVEDIGGQPRLTLEFVRRKASTNPGITYTVEFNSNLLNNAGWSATGNESVTSINATWERVKVTDAPSNSTTRFGRVTVTQP